MNTPIAPTFIVAEISKNWTRRRDTRTELLSERFESVIGVNLARGYVLHDFRLSQVMTGEGTMNETIIAVFRRAGESTKAGAMS